MQRPDMTIAVDWEHQFKQTNKQTNQHMSVKPRHEKTGFLPMRKQRRRSVVQ